MEGGVIAIGSMRSIRWLSSSRIRNSAFCATRKRRSTSSWVMRDCRLEQEPPQGFDVLVVDAFSGDSIPVHLLTREAFELYFRHLKPHGVLAVHISNQYLKPCACGGGGGNLARQRSGEAENEADSGRGICAGDMDSGGESARLSRLAEIEKAGSFSRPQP